MQHAKPEKMLNLTEIARYVDLQCTLVAALRREMSDVTDWYLLLDLPRKGEIAAAGGRWCFSKHGLGVRFKEIETGIVVDVDCKILEAPAAISAGRLAQYLRSKGKMEVPVA